MTEKVHSRIFNLCLRYNVASVNWLGDSWFSGVIIVFAKHVVLIFFSTDFSRKQNDFMLNITRSKVIVTVLYFSFLLLFYLIFICSIQTCMSLMQCRYCLTA